MQKQKCPECLSKNLVWSSRHDPQHFCGDCSARFSEAIVDAIAVQPKIDVVEKVDILQTMKGVE